MTVEEYFEEWWAPKELPENGFNKTAMLDFAEMYHNKALRIHVCIGRIINTKFYEMKHTEQYLQAKWVTENPDRYDERDVVDAKRYCNAYLDGYNQALRIHDVVGQSEQLPCDCDDDHYGYDELGLCNECGLERKPRKPNGNVL